MEVVYVIMYLKTLNRPKFLFRRYALSYTRLLSLREDLKTTSKTRKEDAEIKLTNGFLNLKEDAKVHKLPASVKSVSGSDDKRSIAKKAIIAELMYRGIVEPKEGYDPDIVPNEQIQHVANEWNEKALIQAADVVEQNVKAGTHIKLEAVIRGMIFGELLRQEFIDPKSGVTQQIVPENVIAKGMKEWPKGFSANRTAKSLGPKLKS